MYVKQGLDWSDSSPLNISSVYNMIFNMQCTYHVNLLVLFVLFPRLFQALLMLALDMMDDNDDNSNGAQGKTSIPQYYTKSVLKPVC